MIARNGILKIKMKRSLRYILYNLYPFREWWKWTWAVKLWSIFKLWWPKRNRSPTRWSLLCWRKNEIRNLGSSLCLPNSFGFGTSGKYQHFKEINFKNMLIYLKNNKILPHNLSFSKSGYRWFFSHLRKKYRRKPFKITPGKFCEAWSYYLSRNRF